MLRQIRPSARPSVCMSITLQYCVKTTKRTGMMYSLSRSAVSLVFWSQEWLMGDDPVQVKSQCKEVDSCENIWAVHISSNNSGTVIDSEKVHFTWIESWPWGFLRAINEGRSSPLTSPKWGSDTQICRFSQKFRPKPLKVCYKISLPNNFQRQSCSAINYLSNGINILTWDDPVPVKFGSKGTWHQP